MTSENGENSAVERAAMAVDAISEEFAKAHVLTGGKPADVLCGIINQHLTGDKNVDAAIHKSAYEKLILCPAQSDSGSVPS